MALAGLLVAGGGFFLQEALAPGLSFWPLTLRGQVTDAYTEAPIAGATILLGEEASLADAQGRFAVEDVRVGDTLLARAPDYAESKLVIKDSGAVAIPLRPTTLFGRVLNAQSGDPVPHAKVITGTTALQADVLGGFRLMDVPPEPELVVLAAGYRAARSQPRRTATIDIPLEPLMVKGIYLTFHTLGWEERREQLFDLVRSTELNAVVMDVKGDMGLVHPSVATPLARELGGVAQAREDLGAIVARLKQDRIYAIARIVVFKDDILAQRRPQWAVGNSGTGGVYIDCEGLRWSDPYSQEVWEYNIAIAEQAARIGFDEVQFDYIRFPSDCIRGRMVYGAENTEATRIQAIQGFLGQATARLHPLAVYVSADVFGWTTVREDDMGIGQYIEGIAPQVDYLSPMVYPSTWGPGSLDLAYPPAQPYQIVWRSLSRAQERLQDVPTMRIRPWLQAYNDYQPRKLPYGPREIGLQREASERAGAWGWMLWDPWVSYPQAAFQTVPP